MRQAAALVPSVRFTLLAVAQADRAVYDHTMPRFKKRGQQYGSSDIFTARYCRDHIMCQRSAKSTQDVDKCWRRVYQVLIKWISPNGTRC